MDGWVDIVTNTKKMDVWQDGVKTIIRIAYSNQKQSQRP